MLVPFLITLIVFVILTIYLIVLYLSDILYLIVNVPLLWVVLLRSYFEIRHKRIIIPYFIGLFITTILFLLFFDQIQIKLLFWPVWFATLVFLIAQIVNLSYYVKNKSKKKK